MAEEKSILIIEDKRILKAVEFELKRNEIALCTEIKEFSDFEWLKKKFTLTGSFGFIRTGIKELVNKIGKPPAVIILEYKPAGLMSIDRTGLRLFYLLFLSSLSYHQVNNPEYKITGFLLIARPHNLMEVKTICEHPEKLISNLKVQNPKLQEIIKSYTTDTTRLKEEYIFEYTLVDQSYRFEDMARKIKKLIEEIKLGREKIIHKERAKKQTPIMDGDFEPAKVIFKISDEKYYVDGKIFDVAERPEEVEGFTDGKIYIKGYYINKTVSEVNMKLIKFLIEDLPKIRHIKPESEIKVNLQSAVVDGGTAMGLNMFLAKVPNFKNIIFEIKRSDYNKLMNSPGFISIKNKIRAY